MNAGTICKRDVVTIRETDDLTLGAHLMREKHVGCLIVVEPAEQGGQLKVVGVLTDRDIVVAVLAREVDARTLKVGDVMTRNPLLAQDSQSIDAVLRHMREVGVRRVPVVDHTGHLIGVLSLDDVLEAIAEQLMNVAGSIRSEQRVERAVRQ
jgi:CBS domain-containing protein